MPGPLSRRRSSCFGLHSQPSLDAEMRAVVPDYVRASVPNPPGNRAPWYKNTAPSYAGIFLWVGFYLQLAEGTISQMGVGLAIVALIVAGLLCFGLYYYAPAMLGMGTGLSSYIVGTLPSVCLVDAWYRVC